MNGRKGSKPLSRSLVLNDVPLVNVFISLIVNVVESE